jgi:hypothetical protein
MSFQARSMTEMDPLVALDSEKRSKIDNIIGLFQTLSVAARERLVEKIRFQIHKQEVQEETEEPPSKRRRM